MSSRWIGGEYVYVSEEKADSLSGNLARPGDLIFTQRGTLGQVALVPDGGLYDRYLVSQSQMKLTPDNQKVDVQFLYYYFTSSKQQEYFRQHAIQTGVPHTNLGILRDTPVYLPPLPLQRRIADILGKLDDKIELNRWMNRTLEKMAAAIFKSWFIDFDPVHAKAEGRDRNLPAEIADLFPDTFEDSELGPIPKGWACSTIGKEFNLTMGQSPPGETYNESREGLPFFQGRRDFGFRYPTNRVYCTAPSRYATRGDTLVSVRAPVGDVNMAIDQCSIGRGVAAARHKSTSISYTYYACRSLRDRFEVYNGEGTVFGASVKETFALFLGLRQTTRLLALLIRWLVRSINGSKPTRFRTAIWVVCATRCCRSCSAAACASQRQKKRWLQINEGRSSENRSVCPFLGAVVRVFSHYFYETSGLPFPIQASRRLGAPGDE